jgi:hypothetical protein
VTRLLFLIQCLSIGSDLWIYVETPRTDCAASRQVTQALVTPIEELAAERPDTAAVRDYLAELHQAREDLHAAGTVTVQTRDECRLHWSRPCPSWALSEYAEPRPVNEDALLHPVLIVRHLEYLSRLADQNADDINGATSRLTCFVLPTHHWLRWACFSKTEAEELHVSRPHLMPRPCSRIDWPWRMRVTTPYLNEQGSVRETVEMRYGGATADEVFRALDAGTGILCPSNQ